MALVFGREDRGLTNEALDLCHRIAIIPTDVEYSSLNLAQAFLVFAYELQMLAAEGGAELPEGRRSTSPAAQEDLESMYGALENGLGRIRFFKGTRKADAVVRTLRTVLARADLDRRETGSTATRYWTSSRPRPASPTRRARSPSATSVASSTTRRRATAVRSRSPTARRRRTSGSASSSAGRIWRRW